jgi:predicted amidophosphoribosyltransferase
VVDGLTSIPSASPPTLQAGPVGGRPYDPGMELFPTGCVLCRSGSAPLCGRCTGRLVPPPLGSVRELGRLPALFSYEGTGAAVVRALKFRDGRRLVGPLAVALCDLVPVGTRVVTWVPTSPARRRQRGFDQAELLARALARRIGVPCRSSLGRTAGAAQTGLGRSARLANVSFAPRGRRPSGTSGLVVVDDVCTTGATLRAASRALAAHGWLEPALVVVARTP